MSCRNNYTLTILVLVLLYFILSKPITYSHARNVDTIEFMSNEPNDKESITPSSTYSYGGVPIVYNNDLSDINYYRISVLNGNLNIPNSQALVKPKEKNTLNMMQNDRVINNLSDGTHFCDNVIIRASSNSILSDEALNRFGSIQESYFD